MMYQPTFQYVTYTNSPTQYISSPSTEIEEIDMMTSLENQISAQKPSVKSYRSLSPFFKIDRSSIFFPRVEIENNTSLIEEVPEEVPEEVSEKTTVIEEMLELDIVVRMPPIKEWSARLRVISVEKATPRIVEPEGF